MFPGRGEAQIVFRDPSMEQLERLLGTFIGEAEMGERREINFEIPTYLVVPECIMHEISFKNFIWVLQLLYQFEPLQSDFRVVLVAITLRNIRTHENVDNRALVKKQSEDHIHSSFS